MEGTMTMLGGLIDSRPTGSKRIARRLYTSSGSLILHTVILLSLVTGSYLHVEPLAEPSINVQFTEIVQPPPPAPPPPPPLSSKSEPKEVVVEKPEVIPQD